VFNFPMATSAKNLPPKSVAYRADVLLGLLTLLCLLPFSGKAFHIDDPLFVWAAQQITKHPFDAYGFKVIWSTTLRPMSEVTKNPPLGAYYGALIGSIAGWSERALHIGFLLPALTLVLATYHLARRFTSSAWIAAAAALLTPGFIICSTSVMCDTMMLAIWVVAVLLWIKGLEPFSPGCLLTSALLMAACPLTKYFGMALVPLLFVYSLVRLRRLGSWILFLLIPICVLAGYQMWTHSLYGRGLLSDAAQYTNSLPQAPGPSRLAKSLVGLAFLGGCSLTGLTFVPFLWSRKQILAGAVLSGLAGLAIWKGWIHLQSPASHDHWFAVCCQLTLYFAGGISVLALAGADFCKNRDADSLLLGLWVSGTFIFAAFLNWTINARSILPLIPAVGILLARRLTWISLPPWLRNPRLLIIPLVLSGALSLAAAVSDAELASSARKAAELVHNQSSPGGAANIFFEGHWGFQYYMQSYGAQPVDVQTFRFTPGIVIVVPQNNTHIFRLPAGVPVSQQTVEIKTNPWIATMSPAVGAGFYASVWGPLPFAFGVVPPERYHLVTLLASPNDGTPRP
jgi:4-amino-4-deoxy-L-arabinose transferase-like glycosyltransferase